MNGIPTFSVPVLRDHRAGRPLAGFDAGFDGNRAHGRLWIGLEFEHFGLEQEDFEERVDAGSLERGDLDTTGRAAPVFRGEVVLLELLLDAGPRWRAGDRIC